MKWKIRSRTGRVLALSLLALALPLPFGRAQEKAVAQPGGAVNITVAAGAAPAPPVSITLHERHGHTTPSKGACAHTGGGLIDVATPAPDTVVLTMSGAVVANADMRFDIDQVFEVNFDDPKVKKAKLTVEGRVVGLLRGERRGSAEYSEACASILATPTEIVTLCVPPHCASGRENLAVNDHDGPRTVPVLAGKYTLQQSFTISAHTDSIVCKRPSAEFAPDPALDPLWISYFEPFHGVKKESFGFQVTIKVAPDDGTNGGKKDTETVPGPEKSKKAAAPATLQLRTSPVSRTDQKR
jgi:hypothetical protein